MARQRAEKALQEQAQRAALGVEVSDHQTPGDQTGSAGSSVSIFSHLIVDT